MFKKFFNLKSKLVFKITLFFILCVFVPLLSMTVFNFVDITNKNRQADENYVNDIVLDFEQKFESELNRYDGIVSSLIKSSLITEYPQNINDNLFKEKAYNLVLDLTEGETAVFKSVAIYYFDKNIQNDYNVFFSASDVEREKWYKSFFTSGKYAVWTTDAKNSATSSLYRISKIFNASSEIGIAIAEIDIEKIAKTVSVELRSKAKIFAFDSQKKGFYIDADTEDSKIVEILNDNGFFMRSSLDSTIYCFNEGKEVFAVRNIPEYSLTIGCFAKTVTNIFEDSSFMVLMLVFVFLIVFVLIFYSFIISIFKTLNNDIKKMNLCIEDNFTGRLIVKRNDEVGKIEQQFNFMLDKLDALSTKNILREQAQKQAEIKALQNQMNPHFIYNMLNTFRMKLVISGDQQTAEEIAKFGKLIRYNMHTRENCVTVEEEILHFNYYLDLQNERFTQKILYDVQIPVGYSDIKIPKFILQPLAENSIKYGKKTSVPLKITVSLENINSECVLISFTDNGKGCDRATVQSLNSQFSSGRYIYKSDTETSSTIGLKNINERIRLIYGEDYHITVNSEPDSFFEVIFRFPIIR